MSFSGDLLTRQALTYLCNCINNTANLSKDIVLDTAIQTSSTFSSYHIDQLLTKLKEDNESFATNLVNGINKLTKEVINDKSLVTKENVLYLYKADDDASNNYMQMMLINGVSVELGTTAINFEGYLTEKQCLDKFALKLDLNTLVTSFNTLKDKIGNTTLINDTLVNEILELKDKSELLVVTKSQYETLTSGGKVSVGGIDYTYNVDTYYIVEDDIDTIDMGRYNLTTYTQPTQLGLDNSCSIDDIIQTMSVKASYLGDSSTMTNKTQFPTATSDYTFMINKSTESRYSVIATDKESGKMYTGKVSPDSPFTFNGWRKVCTTSVADVSETFIPSYLNETYVKPTNTNTNSYNVTNGICEVRIEANCLATTNTLTKIVSDLPKAKNVKYANAINRNQTLNTNASALFMISGSDLYVVCNYGDTSVSGSRGFYVSFSYPVAES